MGESRGRTRVLIVGNSGHTRATVRDSLQPKGFTVDMVDSAEQALAACSDRKPDLLVVGTRLPTMDGFVFLTKLTAEGLVIPVILIGEPGEEKRAGLAKQRGAGAFLINPVRVRELVAKAAELTSAEALEALRALQARERERQKLVAQKQAEAKAQADKAATQRRRFKRKDLADKDSQPGAPSGPGKRRRFKRKDLADQPSQPGAATPSGPGKRRRFKRKDGGAKGKAVKARRSKEEQLVITLDETLAKMKKLAPHERLGVDAKASSGAVAKAFRTVGVKFHPDRYQGKSAEARRIAQDIYLLIVAAKNELTAGLPAPAEERRPSRPGRDEARADRRSRDSPPRAPVRSPGADEVPDELKAAVAAALEDPAPPPQPRASDPEPEGRRQVEADESPADEEAEPTTGEAPGDDALEVTLDEEEGEPTETALEAAVAQADEDGAPPAEPSEPEASVDGDEPDAAEPSGEGDEPDAAEPSSDGDDRPQAAEPDGAEAAVKLPGAGRLPGSTPSLLNRQMKVREAARLAEEAEEAALEPFEDAEERRAVAMKALDEGRYRDAKNQLKLLAMHGHKETDILIAQRIAQGHLCRVEGDFDEAAANFEAALDIDPLDKRARQAKAALDAVHQERDKQSSSLLERLLGK